MHGAAETSLIHRDWLFYDPKTEQAQANDRFSMKIHERAVDKYLASRRRQCLET
jgi:hypothetical protein